MDENSFSLMSSSREDFFDSVKQKKSKKMLKFNFNLIIKTIGFSITIDGSTPNLTPTPNCSLVLGPFKKT